MNIREENKQVFQDTKHCYETNQRLISAIKHSKEKQIVFLEELSVSEQMQQQEEIVHGRYEEKANIIVSKNRSFEAAQAYKNQKVCVLNFASATNPGGGVANGSNAQEEGLCRCSTLYPCISEHKVMEQFHTKHRNLLKNEKLDALYNDDCIYTPEVVVFKTDTNSPKLMEEQDWYTLDIISCAAPNLRSNPSNAMNPDSGKKAVSIKPNDLLQLHMKRVRRILDIALLNKEEVVILGAFGCGAFQNPPTVVSEAMARVVKEYQNDFKVIEFAVYCRPKDTENYDTFYRRLMQLNK